MSSDERPTEKAKPESEKNIARLVEHFAYIMGIDLRGYGSTTFKNEAKDRGAEPDECYLIGKKLVDVPEIVLEVIRTSRLLDKLNVYRALGVQEVWAYRDGVLVANVLEAGAYVSRTASALLPSLDLAMVARYATREDTMQALREFEAEAHRTLR